MRLKKNGNNLNKFYDKNQFNEMGSRLFTTLDTRTTTLVGAQNQHFIWFIFDGN